MLKWLLLLSLASLFLNKPVLEVTTEAFPSLTSFNETDNVIIMFFDPSCPFCKKIKPEFEKAGDIITEKLGNISIGTVNLEKEYLIAHKTEITFVPSIRLYRKGEPNYQEIKYFTSSEIVNFVFRTFHLHTYELKTNEEVADFIRNSDSIGFFYGSESDADFTVFKEYLELHENVQISFAHIFNKSIINKMGLDPKHKLAILRKENEEDFLYLREGFNLKSVSDFLRRESFPIINKFDQRILNEIFKTGNGLLVLLKKNGQKKNEKIDPQFKAACEEMRSTNFRCTSAFSDEEYAKALMDKLGLSDSDLPQVRIIKGTSETNLAKFKPADKGFEKENFLKFVDDFLKNKAQQYFKSGPLPPETKDAIKHIVRENYDSVVKDPNFDVFVEFYSPSCQHCEKIENLMKSLSGNLKKVKNLLFVRIDHSKNDIDGIEINELPYILFYPRDEKQNPIRYREQHDYQSLISFLKLHTTVDTSNTILHKDSTKHQDL